MFVRKKILVSIRRFCAQVEKEVSTLIKLIGALTFTIFARPRSTNEFNSYECFLNYYYYFFGERSRTKTKFGYLSHLDTPDVPVTF